MRGRLAGRVARRARHAARDAAGAPDGRAQDRPARRARLQQLVPRRQARQRRRPAQGGDAAARLARDAVRRATPRAGRRGAGGRPRRVRRTRSPTPSRRTRSSRVVREEVDARPRRRTSGMFPLIIATGPLTSDALSADIARLVGARAPLLLRRHQPDRPRRDASTGRRCSARRAGTAACGRRVREHAGRRVRRRGECHAGVRRGRRAGRLPELPVHARRVRRVLRRADARGVGDRPRLRQGDVLRGLPADRGDGAPRARHAALRADEAGRPDRSPRRAGRPYAVVQLRQDNLAGDHFSLVGFQTQLKWGEQARVLRMIPGLERAEFVRFGMVHRNTYINGPTVLRETWQTKGRDDLFFAGQVSGVEGYVESAASGLLAGINAARVARGRRAAGRRRARPPSARSRYYVSHADAAHYQPTNITFGIMPPLEGRQRGGKQRKTAHSPRARSRRWTRGSGSRPHVAGACRVRRWPRAERRRRRVARRASPTSSTTCA